MMKLHSLRSFLHTRTGRVVEAVCGLALGAVLVASSSPCEPESLQPVQGTGRVRVIVGLDGFAAGGVNVILLQGGTEIDNFFTTSNGTLTIHDLQPGTYTVRIVPPNGSTCDPTEEQFVLLEDEEELVQFDCRTLRGSIAGRVTVNGDPAPNLGITVSGPTGAPAGLGTTDASGNYRVTGLAPGNYTVSLTQPPAGATCPSNLPAVVVGNQETVVNFPCTIPAAQHPTLEQTEGPWSGTRSFQSGNCGTPIPATWAGSFHRAAMDQLDMQNVDPQVFNIIGPYNPTTGDYTGNGTSTDPTGLRTDTQVTGNFGFNQNVPNFNGTMRRRKFSGGSQLCEEFYQLLAQRAGVPSSKRFKRDVTGLLPAGGSFLGLRPVSFRYRRPYGDPGVPQIGLIAEEVGGVYPEAMALDADGRPYGIDYRVLAGEVLEELGTRTRQPLETGIRALADAIR
jgi:hypothetical protein